VCVPFIECRVSASAGDVKGITKFTTGTLPLFFQLFWRFFLNSPKVLCSHVHVWTEHLPLA